MTLLDIAGHLPGARLRGNELRAHCPVCESSRDDALSVEMKDEKVLVRCFAHECDGKAIMGHLRQLEVPSSRSSKSRVVETYNYTDGNGEILYAVERLEPKSFRQKRWTKTGWNYKLGDVPRVLYSLPRVLDALDHERTIFLVEGEKDVLTLESMGFTATTCAGGAQSWTRGLATQLRGGNIVAIADNDEAGEKWWAKVEATLQVSAASLRRCHLPGVKQGGDITDWMENHTAEEFEALLSQPEEPKAPVMAAETSKKKTEPERRPFISIEGNRFLAKKFPPVKWYAKGLIHQGVTIFGGRPKQGKSWLSLSIAVNLATGKSVLGHFPVDGMVKTAYFLLEDDESLAHERLEQMVPCGGDLSNLEIVTSTATISTGFIDDVIKLMERDFKVFIIDVLVKIEPRAKNGAKQYEEVYAALEPLMDFRKGRDAAFILITHTRKMKGDSEEENIMGSTGYTATVDAVWVLKHDKIEKRASLNIDSKRMDKLIDLKPRFDGGDWEVLTVGSPGESSPEEDEVIAVMNEDYPEITPAQLGNALGINRNTAAKRLRRMWKREKLEKVPLKKGVFRVKTGTYNNVPPLGETSAPY